MLCILCGYVYVYENLIAVRGGEGDVWVQDGGSNRPENLHKKIILDLYCPRNIIWVIK